MSFRVIQRVCRTLAALFAIGFAILSCSEKTLFKRRVQNTIRASGYIPDTQKMYEATRSELTIYDLRANDVVAEIGFGTGWLTGFLLHYYDSLTYYANDIDEASLAAIGPVTEKYLAGRKSPGTNRFFVVAGSRTATNLPAATFNKVIIRETFHHFDSPDAMLGDVRRILRPGGAVYVYEPAVEKTVFSRDCGDTLYSHADLAKSFSDNGFGIDTVFILYDSPGNIPSWMANPRTKMHPKKVFVLSDRHDR